MGKVLELKDVEEPLWIKEMIKNLNNILRTEDLGSKSKSVLIYNKLPQYLWSVWRDDLRRFNITWQDFLKLLSKNSELVINWAVNETLSWEDLINSLKKIILHYSRVAIEKKGITLEKFLKRD